MPSRILIRCRFSGLCFRCHADMLGDAGDISLFPRLPPGFFRQWRKILLSEDFPRLIAHNGDMENETTMMESNGLKVADRCDACGAQAYVEVVMNSGSLLFCAHHARKFQDSYTKSAVEIRDYTDQLFTKAD